MNHVVRVSIWLVVVSVAGLLLSSCGGDDATPTIGPTSSATASAPAGTAVLAAPTGGLASPTPGATTSVSPAGTAIPTPTRELPSTPGPSPASTKTPVRSFTATAAATAGLAKTPTPTADQGPSPTAGPTREPVDASDRAGLWAGDIKPMPGQTGAPPPWLALRVRPGDNPDEDLWRLESGPWPGPLPPVSLCTPQRQRDGWELSFCTGMGRGALMAFMPAEGDSGLEVTVQASGFKATATLTRIPPKDEPQASSNVTLLWHQPGRGIHTDVWAADGLVFAPRSDGLIEILDAADGTIIGRARAGTGPALVFDVKARDGLLFAASVPTGLQVFDISDPGTSELIGQLRETVTVGEVDDYTNFHNIFLSPDGRLVYAINHSTFPKTDLLVIDVSDPASPTEVGRFSISTDTAEINSPGTHDVNVIEVDGRDIAFLNYLEAGLWILDVTDPAAISSLGSIAWDGIFSHSGWPFSIGDRLYYTHNSEGYGRHMTVLDVTDSASPTVVSRFATRDGISIHNVQVVDGIAYISYYIDGLQVVDLRDPAKPREVAHFDTVPDANERDIAQGAWGVRVLEGVVYVSDLESGIYAFKVDIE